MGFLHCELPSTLIPLKGSYYAARPKGVGSQLYLLGWEEGHLHTEFAVLLRGKWSIPHVLIYSNICLYTSVVFVFSVCFVVCNLILLIKLFHPWPFGRLLWAFYMPPSMCTLFVSVFLNAPLLPGSEDAQDHLVHFCPSPGVSCFSE